MSPQSSQRSPDGAALRRNPGRTWHRTYPILLRSLWGMLGVSGFIVALKPGLRFAPSGLQLQQCIYRMEPLCGAIRDGNDTKPDGYRRVARGECIEYPGILWPGYPDYASLHPDYNSAFTGWSRSVAQSEMEMTRNPTDTAVLPVGYVLNIRVYYGPDTRITLRPSTSLSYRPPVAYDATSKTLDAWRCRA